MHHRSVVVAAEVVGTDAEFVKREARRLRIAVELEVVDLLLLLSTGRLANIQMRCMVPSHFVVL